MPNLVSTGALDTGSITSGFGNIDNGASNITSGGLVKLDVDADADDVSGDSATGRLTIGAGEDLNFYHGGTNSYIVNDTGDLIIKTGASDEDFIIKGNDGGSEITALTLDMSNAGKATFNDGIVATTGTFSGALAGTLSTAAQSNVTSLGTLTALTVDDVAIDGKVVTMTGSSSDTAVFTAGTNGTLSIVTTDAAAAAANITITADGTAELAGTTVTLNSSGGVTLDADNGTITFADAGSSLGTITSSGYSGTSAVATTVTITDNESTNEENVLVFVAGADADGGNVGLESDGDLTYNANTGTLSATALDISGNVDIDGTLETDALSIASTTVTSTAAELNKLDGVGTLAQAGKQTIWVPAASMTPTVSNGCAAITAVETTSGRPDMAVLDFDKDSDEFAQFSVAFPKSWNAGTITFQFFWSGIAATTGVAMNLQGVSFADNDSIDTAYGTAVVVQDDAQGAVEELLVSAESGNITIAGSPGDNELCYFRIGRDVSDGNDDMAGDCRLHGVKLFYTTDASNDA